MVCVWGGEGGTGYQFNLTSERERRYDILAMPIEQDNTIYPPQQGIIKDERRKMDF